MSMDLEKFNPTVADLNALVEKTKNITFTHFADEAQIKAVKEARIQLRDARLSITKKGKELREDALAFQKAVISKEKELVAIVEPEEDRLQAIEDEVKAQKERQERIALLPERKQRLADIKDEIQVDDEVILGMNSEEFQSYCNKRFADKNEADRIANQKKEDELNKEKKAIEDAKKLEEARLKGIEDERLRQEAQKKAEEDRIERERLQKEADEKAEKERLEKDKVYQDFLKDCGVTPETKDLFKIFKTGDEVKVYKLVGEKIIK